MKSLCPVCNRQTLEVRFNVHKIPYFGEVMESSIYCDNCKFKHADVIILEEKEPCRYILKVEEEEDLFARVIRSSQGIIKVPELGVEITPGAFSYGFITNVEGVLLRIEEVLHTLKRWEGENKEKLRKIKELLDDIEEMKKAKKSFTIIIEDKSGNSAIISEKVKKEKLST